MVKTEKMMVKMGEGGGGWRRRWRCFGAREKRRRRCMAKVVEVFWGGGEAAVGRCGWGEVGGWGWWW